MMNHENFPGQALEFFAAANAAAAQIPPFFPLTATVAVNPFLGQAEEPLWAAAARLDRAGGISVTDTRASYLNRIDTAEITHDDLAAALAMAPPGLPDTPDALIAAARARPASPQALPTVADLAAQASGTDWPALIADRIGLWAAGYFDQGQALWPLAHDRAFVSWRNFARRDLTPEIMGLTGFAGRVDAAPSSVRATLFAACTELGLTPEAAPTAFHRLLMSLEGWSQMARGCNWLEKQADTGDEMVSDLLTIRLFWEAALLTRYQAEIGAEWSGICTRHAAPLVPTRDQLIDATLQEASDRAAQRHLSAAFRNASATPRSARPAIQAAFCIDVRSEVLRRALEVVDPDVETLGFAGFFGLAVTHRPFASDVSEARAPVLLAPAVQSRSKGSDSADLATRLRLRAVRAWGRFKLAAVSSFAFVEATGPVYAGKLLRDGLGKGRKGGLPPAPVMDLPLADRIAAAHKVLNAMSLTGNFARVVLITGHGAHVTNAPHGSALQCGACGGHAGDVNARLLAGLLNDPDIRAGLADRGLTLPDDTVFVAGLHDTVSDEVTLYHDMPAPDHEADLGRLTTALASAGRLARTERARRLPGADDAGTLAARGFDWSQVRPEWGLAGCSAFIAAPRHRTSGQDLGGRSFLHSYDWKRDKDFAVLDLILTAPVVVASWISLQYYGSVVAPTAFGAGNKLLHNVVGGFGVVEGNGGSLRTGLPWQSVHDGDRVMHDPLRLSVVIEAPRAAISRVLDNNPDVRALFDNGWVSLHVLNASGEMAWRYTATGWVAQSDTPSGALKAA